MVFKYLFPETYTISESSFQIEIIIYFVSFTLGGPLNVIAFIKSLRAQKKQRVKNQILLLKLNLNIADLLTMFIYVPTQIIWMLAFQVSIPPRVRKKFNSVVRRRSPLSDLQVLLDLQLLRQFLRCRLYRY